MTIFLLICWYIYHFCILKRQGRFIFFLIYVFICFAEGRCSRWSLEEGWQRSKHERRRQVYSNIADRKSFFYHDNSIRRDCDSLITFQEVVHSSCSLNLCRFLIERRDKSNVPQNSTNETVVCGCVWIWCQEKGGGRYMNYTFISNKTLSSCLLYFSFFQSSSTLRPRPKHLLRLWELILMLCRQRPTRKWPTYSENASKIRRKNTILYTVSQFVPFRVYDICPIYLSIEKIGCAHVTRIVASVAGS